MRPPDRKRRAGIPSRFLRVAVLLAAGTRLAPLPALAAEASAPVAAATAAPAGAPSEAPADPPLLDDAAILAGVLDLVAARLDVMTPVAAAKWTAGKAVADPAREQAVLDEAVALAGRMGLAAAPVRDFYALQIALGRSRQEALYAAWRAGGCVPCSPPPDLAALRARIDGINRELLGALYLAAPALAQEDFVERARPIAGQRLGVALPDATDRQQLLAALHAIRFEGAAGLERIRAAGVLRIGTTGDYAPFSVESGGHIRGADIALARALAAGLGLRPVFVRTSWPTLLADLDARRFDVALSGISITPERRAHGRFSLPYQSGGKTLLARCADSARYPTLARVDRRGVRVIVNPGGTNERFVREHIRHARILVHADNRTVFDEIVAGHADVMITDDVEAGLQALRHRELCRTTPTTLSHADKAAWMLDDAALAGAVDAWLAEAIARGLPARELRDAMNP